MITEDEEMVIASITIIRLISMLENRISAMLTAGILDYAKDGVKGKVDARKSSWYAGHKEGLSALSEPLRGRLSATEASSIVSILTEHWGSTLPKLLGGFLHVMTGSRANVE
jgi:hypothetical protein